MRKALLITLFSFCIFTYPAFAAVSIFSVSAAVAPSRSAVMQERPPAKKALYSKGKGVVGLITGLVLGPVGYAGVCIFSHNRTQRKKALLGMEIWTAVALSALVIYLIIKGGFNGSGRGSGGNRGSGRGSAGSRSSGKQSPNIDLSNVDIPGPGSHKRKPAQPVQPL